MRSVRLCLLMIGVLVSAMVVGSSNVWASNHHGDKSGGAAWCSAGQMSASVAKGAHTIQVQVGGALMWFLQLTNRGASCLGGGELDLESAQTANGTPLKLHATQGLFESDDNAKFGLRPHQQAYALVETPGLLAPDKRCRSNVLLTFRMVFTRGTFSVRTPTQVSLCPGRPFSVSETFPATAFHLFVQRF